MELRRQIVDEMCRRDAEPKDLTAEFLRKISGTSMADMAQTRLADPNTLLLAVVAYLDERHEASPR
jgi:hypothetical protein